MPKIVIHPVSTSVPSTVWQRSRNGLSGIGSTEKQPISSTSVVLISPALVWISSSPSRAGRSWPSSEFPVTSSSTLRWAEVKVSARIEAVSDRVAAA